MAHADPTFTTRTWRNWDGRQHCTPHEVLRPANEPELAAAVAAAADAGRVLRPIGSGHSFTDLCVTSDAQLDLSALRGIVDADPASGRVRVRGGTPLHELTEALHAHGLALENQGDIDRQTISGATQTATHGTGARFRNLAAGIVGMRLIDGSGKVRELGPSDPLLRAARVGLGALGVVSELTLQTVPAFRLRKVEEPLPLDVALDEYQQRADEHDHYELYAFPYARRALSITSTRTDDPAAPPPAWKQWLTDDLIANRALAAFSQAGRRLPASWSPRVSRTMTRLISRDERIDHSHRIYASERRVRFTEMEYALPREALIPTLREILALIEARGFHVTFPIEVRVAASDDAHLSTAFGRDTGYIAIHQFRPMDFEPYFAAVEPLLLAAGGRPHWGKRHALDGAALAPRYPQWSDFQAARAQLDPIGTFTSPAIERVLGPPPGRAALAAHLDRVGGPE